VFGHRPVRLSFESLLWLGVLKHVSASVTVGRKGLAGVGRNCVFFLCLVD
jgi:hypothetical protein